LKRMLAFLTVSHVGVFLCGVGLLTARGLAGSTLYVIADGLVKASLFLAVGLLIHRAGSGDELELRGRGRQAPIASAILISGGLLVAGVPPLGSFLGWSLLVRSSADVGYGWLPAVLTVAAVATGGTLLRAAARIVFGWGDAEDPLLTREPSAAKDEPDVPESRLTRPLLTATPLALLAAGIAVGLTPGLAERATAWAQRLEDRQANAAEVLDGKVPPTRPAIPVAAGAAPYAYSGAALVGALGFAFFGLYRRRLPRLLRRSAAPLLEPPIGALKRAHSGLVGDYVAWLTFGVAALGGLVVLLGR
jgi:multicomponent Na+:H+ antiporter subunit D